MTTKIIIDKLPEKMNDNSRIISFLFKKASEAGLTKEEKLQLQELLKSEINQTVFLKR